VPLAPPAVFVPASGGAAPTAPGGIFVPTSGGAAPTAPGAVFVPVAGGATPGAPGGIFVPSSGGAAPTAPGAVFVPAAGGAAPTAPGAVFPQATVGPNEWQTSLDGVNNNLIFSQVDAGTPPLVRMVMNPTPGGSLCDRTGRTITFYIGATTPGNWQVTANGLISLLNANPAAGLLISAAPAAGNDGSGFLSQPQTLNVSFGPVALATPAGPPPRRIFTPAASGGAVTAPPAVFVPA
jgi:hypothetical protein